MGSATETGVAVVKVKAAEKYVSVQLFGRPVSLEYSFKVQNEGSRGVAYSFGGEAFSVQPRETITHTSCAPGDVAFAAGALGGRGAGVTFAARGGLVLRLVGRQGGVVAVEVGE